MATETDDIQHIVDVELQRLQAVLQLGVSLTVCWRPDSQARLSGEVQGTTIKNHLFSGRGGDGGEATATGETNDDIAAPASMRHDTRSLLAP